MTAAVRRYIFTTSDLSRTAAVTRPGCRAVLQRCCPHTNKIVTDDFTETPFLFFWTKKTFRYTCPDCGKHDIWGK